LCKQKLSSNPYETSSDVIRLTTNEQLESQNSQNLHSVLLITCIQCSNMKSKNRSASLEENFTKEKSLIWGNKLTKLKLNKWFKMLWRNKIKKLTKLLMSMNKFCSSQRRNPFWISPQQIQMQTRSQFKRRLIKK